MNHSDTKTAAPLSGERAAAAPVSAFAAIAGSVNGLLDRNRQDLAQKLAVTAAHRFPDSQALADLLEKAMSSVTDIALVGNVYASVLRSPRACPGHYYHLGMFYKRAGTLPTCGGFLRISCVAADGRN